MSCFRCGKELPELQTECDPPCDEVQRDGHFCGEIVCLEIRMRPDPSKFSNPDDFATAMVLFGKMLQEVFVKSGLAKLCKRGDER